KRSHDVAIAWYRVAIGRGNTEMDTILVPLRHADFDPDDVLRKAIAAYEAGEFFDAFARLEPLAVAGNATAQLYLGEAYRHGQGCEKDIVQAQVWLSLAADRLTAESDRARVAAALNAIAAELSAADLAEAKRRARDWWPTAF